MRERQHRSAPQVGDVILIGVCPVFIAIFREQTVGTPRGNIQQRIKIIGSYGRLELFLEISDVGGKASVRSQRHDAVAEPKNIFRRASDCESTPSGMECLMQIVGS